MNEIYITNCFFKEKVNAEMTAEEYKTGMFHVGGLPNTESTQPSSTSENPDTTLSTASNTEQKNEKPLTTTSAGGNLPEHKTSTESLMTGQPESSSTPDTTSTRKQPEVTSSQLVNQSQPVVLPDTVKQAKPVQTSKVVNIKQSKFKPISNTLSALGESLNNAHAKGELKEGSLDTDIQSLLKTIGKLKSQVDTLRNDETHLSGSDDGSQSGSQSEGTHMSNSLSSSSLSIPSASQSMQSSKQTSQSLSNTVDKSDSRKGLSNETSIKSNGHMPLKLKIVGQATSTQEKNPTTFHLKLTNPIKKNVTSGKVLIQNAKEGMTNIKPASSESSSTTMTEPVNSITTGQSSSTEGQKKPTNFPTMDSPLTSKGSSESQIENVPNVGSLEPNVQLNPKQPELEGSSTLNTQTPGKDVKLGQSLSVTSAQTVKQSQTNKGVSSAQQDINRVSMNDKQATLTDNGNMTTSPGITPQNKEPQTSRLTQDGKVTTQRPSPASTVDNTKPNSITQQSKKPEIKQDKNVANTQTTKLLSSKTTSQMISPITQSATITDNSKTKTNSTQQPASIKPPANQVSPQNDITTSSGKLEKPQTISKAPLHSNTQSRITKPAVSFNGPSKTADPQKTKDFTAIESSLARNAQAQQATEKSSIPGK